MEKRHSECDNTRQQSDRCHPNGVTKNRDSNDKPEGRKESVSRDKGTERLRPRAAAVTTPAKSSGIMRDPKKVAKHNPEDLGEYVANTNTWCREHKTKKGETHNSFQIYFGNKS